MSAPATIVEEAAKDPASKIGAAYASFLDEAAVEAKGLAPFEPWLDEVRALSSKPGYAALVARADRHRHRHAVRRCSSARTTRSRDQLCACSWSRAASACPTAIIICSAEPKLAETRAKYLEHLTSMLTLAGEANAAARAKAIMDFETQIAKVHWTRIDSRDATKIYNMMTAGGAGQARARLRLARRYLTERGRQRHRS